MRCYNNTKGKDRGICIAQKPLVLFYIILYDKLNDRGKMPWMRK